MTDLQESLDLLVDHHAHVFGDAVRARMRPFVGEVRGGGVDELIEAMDSDGVDRAALLSVAYMFAMPDAGPPDLEALSAENDRVAEIVGSHSGRFAGFFSVNPLLASAREEVERCATSRRFAGIKLHLANSDVDLREPSHRRPLGAVLAAAEAHELVVAVHLRTRRADYGEADATAFAELVAEAGCLVQVAHGAGWGGYDHATDDALAGLLAAANRDEHLASLLYVDLSAVDLTGARAVTGEPVEELMTLPAGPGLGVFVDRLEALPDGHVLFGSDFPVARPGAYADQLRVTIAGKSHCDSWLSNRAPWIREAASDLDRATRPAVAPT